MAFLPTLQLIDPTTLQAGERVYRCTIGRGGLIAGESKREGDGCTPRGRYHFRPGYFRPDRIAPPPISGIPLTPLSWNDGWCDAPEDAAYNQFVKLPYPASHEALWRKDHAYDLILPIGYNDAPVIPGCGSAIFMHVMHDSGQPTAGCIALSRSDLLSLLPLIDAKTVIEIR